mgnify:CR=1 FL=1
MGLTVLSLFDGMSCGQIALERAGIKVDKYYASEIDKYAIQVTQSNYPNTIQLGDVRDIQSFTVKGIDLLIAGSPCQGFSPQGKQLNFEDPRSALFFEYVRVKKELNPRYFLLENVKMKKEYENIISEHLGVTPIDINSNLVSAQNRRRVYWTNIPDVTQPEDRKVFLKSIIDRTDVTEATPAFHQWFKTKEKYLLRKKHINIMNDNDKAICATANQVYNWNGNVFRIAKGRYRFLNVSEAEQLQTVPGGTLWG